MTGAGFEFAGGMIVPLGTPYIAATDEPLPGAVTRDAAAFVPQAVTQSSTAALAPATAPTLAINGPRAVLKAARARTKEIRAELRRMKALQKELAELERLLKAARQKPQAPVRALRAS